MEHEKFDRAREALKDLGKATLIGIILAAGLSLLLFLLGLLIGSNGVTSGLEAAKDGDLIVAAAGLFLIAGMLMMKGKKPENASKLGGLTKHFTIIGPKWIISMNCMVFLIAAELMDRLLLHLLS